MACHMLLLTLSVLSRASVFQLDERAFRAQIIKGRKGIPWFVMFSSANCPACVQAAPEFDLASEKSRGFARFAIADTRACPNIAASLGVRAVPAFFLFTSTATSEFHGARTSGGFLQFISESIGEGLEEADEGWVDNNENKVILFTRRFKPPALFSAAYGAFKSKGVMFGMARDSETIEMFGNPPIPSIWMFKASGEKEMYKGKQEFMDLIDKISEFFAVELDDPDDL